MNIKKVETILTCPGRNYLIVKIELENGLCGYGDATLNGRELAVKALIDEHLAKTLVGMDASRINDIWTFLAKSAYWRGGPIQMTAIAGIDMALWDIKGKMAQCSVCDLLGGKARDYIDTYVHVHGHDYEALKERIKTKAAEGYKVLRYSFDTEDPENGKCYIQPHQDVAQGRIETKSRDAQPWDTRKYYEDFLRIAVKLREDFGPDVAFIHDTHGRLKLHEAVSASRELEKCHMMFWEDPVDPFYRTALRHLRQVSAVPVGIGELYNTLSDYHELISENLIDYVRADISHFGGITPLVQLAHFADRYGIETAFHGPSDISPLAHASLLNIDLTLPNFAVQETVLFEGTINEVFSSWGRYENGKAWLNPGVGLGVSVNEEAARDYPYVPASLPYLRDNTGAIVNW